jgi:hypothetical protein
MCDARRLALSIQAFQFLPDYHTPFTRPPADPASAFVPLGVAVDLDQLLAEEGERLVGRDNVVSFEGRALQLAKPRGRRSCAGAARDGASPPQWRAHGVARPAVPGSVRRPGPAAGRAAPPTAHPFRTPPRRFPASRPKNARAHSASNTMQRVQKRARAGPILPHSDPSPPKSRNENPLESSRLPSESWLARTLRRPLLYPTELQARALTVARGSRRDGRAEREVVGASRFERPTSCSQGRRATRLRHAPTRSSYTRLRSGPPAQWRRARRG